MDEVFFNELKLPQPHYENVNTRFLYRHGAQTAEMLNFTESVFLIERPKRVIVGGDANTNLAAGLAARKLGLKLYHLEAGLRSRDWRMPEEHNRVMLDHISDVLLSPTDHSARNLNGENVQGEIHVVGNTIVDAVQQNVKLAELLDGVEHLPDKYCVLTIHREEILENQFILHNLFDSVQDLLLKIGMEVVFPIHPRSLEHVYPLVMGQPWCRTYEPLGYLTFLKLLKNAQFVMTDSGGVQEEACILGIPCFTLRDNTERPETVDVGAKEIVGEAGERLTIALYNEMLKWPRWVNPFGNGTAAKQICDLLEAQE
jgi:UDP-N-acetylglucosamine 2-epimerase (non-hydrolysing)